jgi:hypothetical protein
LSNMRIEIGRVNVRLQGGQWTPRGAEKVARSIIQHVHEGLAERQQPLRGGRKIERLAPDPIHVPHGTPDNLVAQRAAIALCRALGEN